MFNDKLGPISLNRDPRKRKQEKSRKTQKRSNFKNVNSYSLDPFKRYTTNIAKVSGDDVTISYSQSNPTNQVQRNTGFSFGNVIPDEYTPHVDNKAAGDNKKEYKNSKYDVLKRNPMLTDKVDNDPFKSENKDYLKASIGESTLSKKSSSFLFSNSYENYDTENPFVDDHTLEIDSKVYIVAKNYYNKGNIKPFIEKSNVFCNSIVEESNSNGEYYKNHETFSTFGYVYESKKPDSIAFGGLKR